MDHHFDLIVFICYRYGEVLRMLGTRNPTGRLHDNPGFRAGIRRRHGSLSSLPSSSVSGRPLRDRKRIDDRRKVRDMKVNTFKHNLKLLYAAENYMPGYTF